QLPFSAQNRYTVEAPSGKRKILRRGRRGPGPRNQRPSRGAAAWEDRGDRCVCNIVKEVHRC
ncbi:MAG TPA: hypothetical protein K8V20_06665, partial [Subdoligranulum variabile]|nr:hypothetical protein [Subdoligranulum variabile]